MSLRNLRLAAPVAAALALATSNAIAQAPAQEPTTGRKIGEKLDGALQDVKGGLQKAGESIKGQYAKSKESIHNMGVEGRVYGRLHWDKALKGATIDLSMSGNGVVTLEGTVASEKAKARAVDLAKETEGVEEVVDHLAIRPAATRATTERP